MRLRIVEDKERGWRSEPNPEWRARTLAEIEALVARRNETEQAR
ncbi:hypothetical protein [Paraburkholderia tropica]|nr:hypothetical protein [Paraburkholderia tropica]